MANSIKPKDFKFEIGQLVHHKRYGYRGVIYDHDPNCTADPAWYQKNQTQPDRDQPWYHVLVDGGAQTTYVAQSNLEPDETCDPIVHPLIDVVFKTYLEGRYYRENLN